MSVPRSRSAASARQSPGSLAAWLADAARLLTSRYRLPATDLGAGVPSPTDSSTDSLPLPRRALSGRRSGTFPCAERLHVEPISSPRLTWPNLWTTVRNPTRSDHTGTMLPLDTLAQPSYILLAVYHAAMLTMAEKALSDHIS